MTTTALRNTLRALRPLHWKIAESLPQRARRRYLFAIGTGRFGNFEAPVSFNEKIQWRILHDRRERLVMACDKLAMKEYVASLGVGNALRIPQTYWYGEDIETMPDLDSLPPWVLKPNHGCGDVIIGPVSREQCRLKTGEWMRSRQAEQLGEWGYTQARPLLLLEEKVPAQSVAPCDYKFLVFSGEPVAIQVTSGRFTKNSTLAFYDPEWRKVAVHNPRFAAGEQPRPALLSQMTELAAHIGADWDFIRVDLYATDEEVWFGELSPYPGGGVVPFTSREFDLELGRRWRLPRRDIVTQTVRDSDAP